MNNSMVEALEELKAQTHMLFDEICEKLYIIWMLERLTKWLESNGRNRGDYETL